MLSPLPPAVPCKGTGHSRGLPAKGRSTGVPGHRSQAPGAASCTSLLQNLPFPFLGLLLERGHAHLQPGQTEGEER